MKNTISQEKIKSIFRRLKQLKKLFKEEKTYNLILEKIYYLEIFFTCLNWSGKKSFEEIFCVEIKME